MQHTLEGGLVVNEFDGGIGGSFPFTIDGVEYTLGKLHSGDHPDFGPAARQETLLIITGGGQINGEAFGPEDLILIQKGGTIKITVSPGQTMTYLCGYEVQGALAMTEGQLMKLTLANNRTVEVHNNGLILEERGWVLPARSGVYLMAQIAAVDQA